MQKLAFPKIGLTLEDKQGVKVTQNGKSYFARDWQLTDDVEEVIETSIRHGVDKLWVEGHPSKWESQHIYFSKSNSLPRDYLIGGEGLKMRDRITINKKHKEILDTERQKGNLKFCEQNGMGRHLVIDWDKNTLIKVIEATKRPCPVSSFIFGKKVAGVTGLEPAASGVTGQRSNQLSYTPELCQVRSPQPCDNPSIG